MWEVPVGFVRTNDDRIEKSADRQVQHAVCGVSRSFANWVVRVRPRCGTVRRNCGCPRYTLGRQAGRFSGAYRVGIASTRCC
jgi:hypothetical protein